MNMRHGQENAAGSPEPEQLQRKLAAILYADVAGYSRLTGIDEEGTHRRLRSCLDAVTDAIEKHGGTVMHFAGDAVLAEFASVVHALACAVNIQNDLAQRNEDLTDDRKVQFRIGINLGDVIVDRDEIYGDGVNVAARLETLAIPGGICVSESVRTALGTKLPLDYEFLGEQPVKNIAEPVKAYHARLKLGAVLPKLAKSTTLARVAPSKRPWIVASTAIAVIAVVGVMMTWLAPWTKTRETIPTPRSDKPAIAVLPFDNLSDDREQEYFSDGITEDLITDLSKVSNLLVIARNSVFTYKGRAVKVSQVRDDLGVQYVLEGSVRKHGNRVRITAQLIDANTGYHLWAQRYDRELRDIFALQDEVTQKIVAALSIKLSEDEEESLSRRHTTNVEAYDYFLRGQPLLAIRTKQENERAREMYQRAVTIDSGFARAYAGLALTHAADFRQGWTTDAAASRAHAVELARKAVMIDDGLPQAHWVLGYVYNYEKQHDRAIEELEKAIALDPNYADAFALLAGIQTYIGEPWNTKGLLEKAMQLNPHAGFLYFEILGRAYYMEGRYKDALAAFQKVIGRNPAYLPANMYLAMIYSKLGNKDEAAWQTVQIKTMEPHFSPETWVRARPYKDPTYVEKLLNDLRKAGM